ncbi:isopeptide-forming domain-containing fimbrial protein [Termitidicoccus mucosus]|uniref:isopeptide-forming domain-containing fimbrial protein n=1 Tax=Termitidicoccus mucosus TaxID=1184151 RepID=UPI0031830187
MKHTPSWCGRSACGLPFCAAFFALLLCAFSVDARAALAVAPSFIPAQSGRTWMDIGGVWNGSAEADADTVRLTITNDAVERYEFGLAVTLPAHFHYVPGTASLYSSTDPELTGVTAAQTGNTLTFTFPEGYDLPADATLVIDYGIIIAATTDLAPGTYEQLVTARHAEMEGGAATLQTTASLGIFVRAGASMLIVTAGDGSNRQTKAVGETATFHVTVANTGLGALFDVAIDESLIFNASDRSLQLTGMEKIAPASRAATGSMPILVMPYLAPGESFVVEVQALVTDCDAIFNTVSTYDITGGILKSADSAVTLDLKQPLITYTPPNVTLAYGAPVPVGPFVVANTKLGPAHNVVLQTNLHQLGVMVDALTDGWSYDPGTGAFTYTGNADHAIANGIDIPLGFSLETSSYCNGTPGGVVIWRSSYTNGCGDPYATPTAISIVFPPTGAPAISLGQSVSRRIAIGDAAQAFVVTLSAENTDLIDNDTIVVTETLPAGLPFDPLSITATAGDFAITGDIITWTVGKGALAGGSQATLTVPFEYTHPCDAGVQYTATAGIVGAQSIGGCALGSTASATFFLSNNPAATVEQYFNIASPPEGGVFETGRHSTDASREIALGEGEFVSFEASYAFGAGYIGTWNGSTYVDDFGGAGIADHQRLVPDTLQYSINGGSTWAPVPSGFVTGGNGAALNIQLDFITGVTGSDSVDGKALRIRYQATLTDSALGGGIQGEVLQVAQLSIAGVPAGAPSTCTNPLESNFRQGVYYNIARAAASVSVSFDKPDPARCEIIGVTLAVDKHPTGKYVRNLDIVLDLGSHYEFLPEGEQSFSYSGDFNSGNLILSGAPGAPVFTYNPANPLTQASTVTFRVRLKPGAPIAPAQLKATVNYDDLQTSTSPDKTEFATSAHTQPILVRSAQLAIRATPDTVIVSGQRVEWDIHATNTGDGIAYDSQLTNRMPFTLKVDEGATNAANSGAALVRTSTGSGPTYRETLAWTLGDIAQGDTVTRRVIAIIDTDTSCAFANGSNEIEAHWGCGDSWFGAAVMLAPKYTTPQGQMLVAHDTANSVARLCGDGLIEIIVRNTGAGDIHNVVVKEVLDSSLIFKTNTAQYSIDGGAWTGAPDPDGLGTITNPYQWTSAGIAKLTRLRHAGASSESGEIPQEIRIRFNVTAGGTFPATTPTAAASATGQIACGDDALSLSPGIVSIKSEKPEVTVTKTARNDSAGQTAFAETVYGGRGDTIEWRIVIANTGNVAATHLRLSDALSGTGGAAIISSADDTGSGFSPGNILAGQVISLSDLPAGATRTYLITEVLGSDCNIAPSRNTEVSWGCDVPPAGQHNDIDAPGTPMDAATLILAPAIGAGTEISQTITYLSGGRARVVAEIINRGGNAYNLSVTNTFPNPNMVLDETATPVVAHDRLSGSPYSGAPVEQVTSVVVNNDALLSPEFTLHGAGTGNPAIGDHILRYGDRITLTYYVRSAVFDEDFANTFPALTTQDSTNSRDPAPPASGNNTVKVDYRNSCDNPLSNSHTATIDLLSPNLDITAASPGNFVITDSTARDYTFTLQNVGDAGSLASHITADFPELGTGWTINSIRISAATAGTGGTVSTVGANATLEGGLWTFAPLQLGTLGTGGSITITVNAAYSGTPASLRLRLRVRGEARGADGAAVTNYYSHDQRGQRVIGVELDKTVQGTSEPDAHSSGANVLIGEEATFRLRARLFGAEAGVSGIRIHDTPTDSNGPLHLGLAYVSHTPTGDSKITPSSVTPPLSVREPPSMAESRVVFVLPDLSETAINNDDDNLFETDLTVRVLNIAGNVAAVSKSLRNNLGLQFNYLGQLFRSNDTDDAFSTGGSDVTPTASLHRHADVTVHRPALDVTRQVRNRGPGGTATPAFADTLTGAQAGDVIEYRIEVKNTAPTAGLFSLHVEDTLPAKVVLVADAAGLDTNNDGIVDVAGGTIASGNKMTFDWTVFSSGTEGSNLVRLDAGVSLVLLYRGTLDSSVNPLENLQSVAKVVARSVPVNSDLTAVNQTGTMGVAADNNTDGTAPIAARTLTAERAATVAVAPISVVENKKQIIARSVATDMAAPVVIGEQIRYQIGLVIPKGTVPRLKVYDQLPAGLEFLNFETVQFGEAFADDTQPNTQVEAQSITWDFGDNRLVNDGTPAERTVLLTYVAQVRNVAANIRGASITNAATFTFTVGGTPEVIAPVTVAVAEPNVTLTRQVRNVTRSGSFSSTATADAGDIIEYQVALTNATGTNISTARDLNLVETLPLGLTYVLDSTISPSGWAALGNPQITGDADLGYVLTWGRGRGDTSTKHDLAPGESKAFTFQVTVDNTSRPLQQYQSILAADWTSLDGAGPILDAYALGSAGDTLGERTGVASDTLNTYLKTTSITATALNSTSITKVKSGDTLPRTAADETGASPDGFRIGDIITYTVTATLQEGTLPGFRIDDTLPSGLAFIDTVSILPATHAGIPTDTTPFFYTTPDPGNTTAPATGATGAIAWQFGNLVNSGDNNTANDTLVLTYRARVIDVDGLLPPVATPAATATTLENSAAPVYRDALDNPAGPDAVKAPVTIRQPRLTLTRTALDPDPALCSANVLRPGDTGKFRLTVTNTGTAPAYNIRLTETLPFHLRDTPPQLSSASIDGSPVTDLALIDRVWNDTTGVWTFTLADAQILRPDQTLVLNYTYTVDATAPKGETLSPIVGIVTEYYSLPPETPVANPHRRQYAPVSATDNTIIIGLEIKGFVYNDIEPNGHRDGFEDWSAGPAVYVNLVNSSNQVCRSVQVAAASAGDYLLPRVAPGSYRVIVTDSATSITAAAPLAWLFRSPADGIRPVTLGKVDLLEENFGLYQGTGTFTGVVFKDAGDTSGTGANNGQQDPAEPGIAGVTVRLLKSGTEIATAVTDGSGRFALYVPSSGPNIVSFGDTLVIEEVNPAGYISTGATVPAGISGDYNRGTDCITFTYILAGSMSGFRFGDVPVNAFHTDGAQTILPGAVAFYRHTFVAGTAGTVTFTSGNSATPDIPWAQVILRDNNCNGTPGSAVTTSIAVKAGDEVCIILKDASPAGAPWSAVNTTTVIATFVYTGADPALLDSVLARQDVTTVGAVASAGLQLVKNVDKNTATPGAEIEYTITYTNTGAGELTDLFIADSTPAYTTFIEASAETPFPADLDTVVVTAPSVGGTGAITWTFTGALAPGAGGTVRFKIKVDGQ